MLGGHHTSNLSKEWLEERPDYTEESVTTFIFNPFHKKSIREQKNLLPIHKYKDHVIYLVEHHQVVILVGETGSGKSTQVPQFLLDAGWACDDTQIAVTQPRRIAATTLATRVAEEMNTTLGKTVGYSIRFDEKFSPRETRIKYMTEGMLLKEMLADPLLKNYSVIMVDEVHERSINTDIVLSLLKKILKKRPELRLIISSATCDAEELKSYYTFKNVPKKKEENMSQERNEIKPPGILNIVGKCFPVEVFYASDPVSDYLQASVETVLKICRSEPPGDILVFLTGKEEVESVVQQLHDYSSSILDSSKEKFKAFPMHGSLTNDEQLKVFKHLPHGFRKVIVATNVAEASITIPGIVYVIDCGFVKLRWFNADSQTDALIVVPISQASAQQRAGRAGRVRPGKVYRLYKEEDFWKLSRFTLPELQRTSLAPAVLQLKALGVDDVVHFDFPCPPPARHLAVALELLYALKAIDDSGRLTDPLGLKLAELPVDPIIGRMLIMSGEFGCSKEITLIVAMMQVQTVFYFPTRGQESIKARTARRRFEAAEGDLITYLNVATAYLKYKDTPRWCQANYINEKAIRRSVYFQEQLLKLLKRLRIPISSAKDDVDCVLRCIASSFFPNTAYLHSTGVYRTILADVELHVHPHSALYTQEKAPWIVYGEVLQTTQLFIKDITVVDPDWLKELAPHYFHIVTER